MGFFTITDIVVIAIGVLFLLFYIYLYFKGKKDAALFATLGDEDYPMHELYFVGYALVNMLGLDFRRKEDREVRKQIAILYGEKYIDYYLRVSYAQRFTMMLTLMTFAMPLYCFTRSLSMFLLFMVVGGVAFYYYGTVMKEKIQKRSDEMLDEFTEVISKLALLVNAGMTLHEAWEKVANSNEGVLYGEMKISVDNMNNGIPEVDALYEFGQRSMVQEVKKFISTIVQGLTKGNKDLTMMLIQQSKEQWKLKQQYLRRKGEAANSKLLLPMLLIFIAILIMVVVPIFSNIGL